MHWFCSSLQLWLLHIWIIDSGREAACGVGGDSDPSFNPVGDVASPAGLLVTPFFFACSELCPFASFSGSRHILCKERLAPGWQEEAGWLLLSNV